MESIVWVRCTEYDLDIALWDPGYATEWKQGRAEGHELVKLHTSRGS